MSLILSQSTRVKIILILFALIANNSIQSSNISDSLIGLLDKGSCKDKLGIALMLNKINLESNPEKSLEYAHIALAHSNELNDIAYEEEVYLTIATTYFYVNKLDSVILFTDKLKNKLEKYPNDTLMAKTYLLLSDVCNKKGEHDVGIGYINNAITIFKNLNMEESVASSQKDIAQLYIEKGEYDTATEYLDYALEYFNDSNDTISLVLAMGTLANIYNYTSNIDKEKEQYLLMMKYLSNQKSSVLYGKVMGAMAGIYRREGKIDSALIIQQQSLELAEKEDNKYKMAVLYLNMANTVMMNDESDKALELCRKAKSLWHSMNMEKYVIHSDYTIGEIYYAIGMYDSSEIYLLKSLDLSKEIDYSWIYRNSLRVLTAMYEAATDYKKALAYQKTYHNYLDSINSEDVQMKIANLEAKFQTAQKEKEIIVLKKDKENQLLKEKVLETRQYILLASIGAILIIFGLLINSFLVKRRKQQQIHLYEKKLLKTEVEKKELRKKELETELEYKSRQMTTHTLNMMQKNKVLREMTVDITNISNKADNSIKQDLKRLKFMLNQSLRADKDWDEFRLYFEQVNKTFFSKLKEISPNISPAEERLAALIKLKMNIKETASVLNISPSSVKMARHRLRQKLNLPQNVDLYDFIGDVG